MECKNCGQPGEGKFCSACGEVLKAERINLPFMLHEVINTFTYLERGFLYTFKQLAYHPGIMQRNYLSGLRLKNQKPFPMFVISGTICALALYLIYTPSFDSTDRNFYRNYYVLVQTFMLPFYALTTWLLFKSSKLYYAEILVLIVYMLAFMSLLIIPINIVRFFFNNGVLTLVEAVVLACYNTWTFLKFFHDKPIWLIIVKSVFTILINFILFQVVANLVISWLL